METTKHNGILIGVLFITLLLAPQVWWFASGNIPAPDIQQCAYFILLACLMLLSYYQESKSFLFRWVMWSLTHFHFPRGRWLALLYSVLFVLLAFWRLSKSL